MSESGDFTPASWATSDFKSAKRAYDAHARRSYDDATAAGKNISEVLEKRLKTNCRNPLIIMCDQTGSMGEWPAVIFSKLPYLCNEVGVYLGKDAEVAFGAIGDARNNERYPLQARPFGTGEKLLKSLKELIIEGNGGGNSCESYELALVYCLRNVDMPKAVNPVLIMICDEDIYDSITKAHAASYGIEIDKAMKIEEICKGLQEMYGGVYILRKPYGGQQENGRIHARWAAMLGSDHVIDLDDPQRAVDVIFGILAKESGKVDYFRDELEERQKPAQVKTVYKALETVHGLPPAAGKTRKALGAGKSTMHRPSGKTKKSGDLL